MVIDTVKSNPRAPGRDLPVLHFSAALGLRSSPCCVARKVKFALGRWAYWTGQLRRLQLYFLAYRVLVFGEEGWLTGCNCLCHVCCCWGMQRADVSWIGRNLWLTWSFVLNLQYWLCCEWCRVTYSPKLTKKLAVQTLPALLSSTSHAQPGCWPCLLFMVG